MIPVSQTVVYLIGFNKIASINMIYIHKSVPANIDTNEILDINEFPDTYNTPNTK